MFEYSVVDNVAKLEWLHLSIGECFAAASLCRPGVKLCNELDKIVDEDRYFAVSIFFSGFHSQVAMIKTNTNIGQNFLSFIGNNTSQNTIQQLYKNVMDRSFKGDSDWVVFNKSKYFTGRTSFLFF